MIGRRTSLANAQVLRIFHVGVYDALAGLVADRLENLRKEV